MKQLLVLLAAFCAGHAVQTDLSEKVFSFPVPSSTAAVKLVPYSEEPLRALTMCMRFFSSLTRAQSLFSLAVPSQSNAFLLYKPSVGVYRLHVSGVSLELSGMPDDLTEWNSVCWTWDSTHGLTTLWVNGKRSDRKILAAKASLSGAPSIILGQEQDTYGGGYDQAQSFGGDITDVHLWSSVISPCEIRSFMDGGAFTPGNLLNWKNMQYSIAGPVYMEPRDFDKLSCF
ncbi:serum amyloid P-component-like [Notolabrus celidotus]|uniref:serum amyloid P-component-like n=1 Tax=Notolabrus celidotus TaxID=1203425 RepID=UPI00148FE3F4|nr:serum amyloid P-component-like [Notolabrus celidotus]